jgi:hypothetical protein
MLAQKMKQTRASLWLLVAQLGRRANVSSSRRGRTLVRLFDELVDELMHFHERAALQRLQDVVGFRF